MTNRGQLVLIVEDDPQMFGFMRPAMMEQGFRVLEVDTFTDALHVTRRHTPDLVILDRGVAGGGGVEFIEHVRTWSRVPIIVISARGDDVDKVTALDAGADDYLTKPFTMMELLARIRVALRRANGSPQEQTRGRSATAPALNHGSRRRVSPQGGPAGGVAVTAVEVRCRPEVTSARQADERPARSNAPCAPRFPQSTREGSAPARGSRGCRR